jgi:hypothetical protein
MVSMPALWLPVLLAPVLVFVVSSIIHMVLRYHRNDFERLPNEDAVRAAMNRSDLRRGQYAIPFCDDMKQMQAPDMVRKYDEGPVAIVTVMRRGRPHMGKHLAQWFLFNLGIAIFVAYLAGRTLPAGTAYGQVFRVAGTIAFLGYAGGLVWSGIWKGVPWSKVWKDVFDGLIFALMVAGAFAGFWPR